MDADSRQPKAIPQTIKTFANREQDDPGDVRAYLPGDPVNRIHWKLTAKRDELLVREQAQDKTAEEAEIKAVLEAEQPAANQSKKHIILIGFLVFLFSLILLLIIPSANQGMQALLNRLFDASEAVNAYAYERFAVSADMPVAFAVVLLTVIGISLLVMTLLSGSRLLALGIIAGCALFQMYFGLAFSTWINVPLFALFVFWMLKRPWDKRTILCVLAGVTAVTIAVLLIWPGVDAATEAEAVPERSLSFTSEEMVRFSAALMP